MKRCLAALAAIALMLPAANCMQTVRPARAVEQYSRPTIYRPQHIVRHPAGCPRTNFCGCGVSVKLYGHPVRSLYRAANYSRFRRATPAPGMVAYRNHHVFYIEQVLGPHTVLAYDPNSGGHKTRVHAVSLRGYRVVNPNASRVASR